MIGVGARLNHRDQPETEAAVSGVRQHLATAVAGAVVLVAAALRGFRIDGQSLWYDEGVSAAMAPRDILDITVRSAADIHPPLYYYLLHFWSQWVGTSELALRWLSLAFGVLLVAVVYSLGRRLFNSQVGLYAALFAGISPFLVYYSQETRMYSQVTFLAALSFYLFTRLLEKSRPNRVIAVCYVLVTSAMLHTHYFSFAVLLAQNVIVLAEVARLAWVSRRVRESVGGKVSDLKRHGEFTLAYWIVIQLVTVATYVPWLIFAFDQLQAWPSISEGFSFLTLVRRVFLVFSFGLSPDAVATRNREVVFYALVAAVCLLPLARYARKRLGSIAVTLYLAVPVLALYWLSLRRPMYNPKFLLLAAPAYCILLGVGLENLRQSGGLAVRRVWRLAQGYTLAGWSVGIVVLFLALVAYPSAKSLTTYYFDPRYARDDYRGLASFIASRIRPGDAIILNAPGQEEIFRYYYKGEQPIYPLPRQRPLREADTLAELRSIADRHLQIWLVLWATAESDPQNVVERWLDENSFKADNRWFGNIRLCRYSNDPGLICEEKASVSFENGITLDGIQVGTRLLEPGESVNLVLGWSAVRKIEERYTVFVHLVDDTDLLWGQMDSEPAGGSKPTDGWVAGMKVEDRRGIPVLPGTPPGKYRLELGLYQPASGKRLGIVDQGGKITGDRYLFGTIEVAAPKSPQLPTSLEIRQPLAVQFANRIRLLGFALSPLGRDAEGPVFSGGDTAHLTLFWQSDSTLPYDASMRIEVRDSDGRAALRETQLISSGRFPTSKWREGDLVRDQYRLRLEGLESGEYEVFVTQLDESGRTIAVASSDAIVEDGAVRLGPISVK